MCYNYKYDTAETIKGDSSMVPWRYCPFLVPASARRAAAEKFVEWKGKHLMKKLLYFQNYKKSNPENKQFFFIFMKLLSYVIYIIFLKSKAIIYKY